MKNIIKRLNATTKDKNAKINDLEGGAHMPVLAFLPEFVVKDKVKRDSSPKVTEEDVKNIRELHKSGLSFRQLGHKYDISHEMCRRICNGYCYKEVF
nr:hypothetical protein [Acinetobacter baumannii]